MNFKNKTIMITGAAGNLGRAVANAFHQLGANLVLLDRQTDSLQRAFGKEDDRRAFFAVDLLNQAQLKDAVESSIHRFGRIDVLCNVAGGFRMGPPVHETPDQDWNFLFDLNTRSLLHAVRAVVPGMLASRDGKIVNIAANSAQKGVANMGAYCASKDVVIRVTEAMAAELRDSNINVNCVMPSIIDTPENRAAMPNADFSRWVAPEALADVIVFLASDGARAIHGAALPVVGRS
ncbi:MAG TPA: SDR family NAD(P)-dependent oxidoreductase [Noviherbaspirillum sp.]|nr:SDR family NAD(P)-dependent oxidoreductase [Noviherbaspirillum sp.]